MKNVTEEYLNVFEEVVYTNVELSNIMDVGSIFYSRMHRKEIRDMNKSIEEIAKLCSRIRNGEIRIIEMPKNND